MSGIFFKLVIKIGTTLHKVGRGSQKQIKYPMSLFIMLSIWLFSLSFLSVKIQEVCMRSQKQITYPMSLLKQSTLWHMFIFNNIIKPT